ncbi:tetraacyldisaccharide 4'-kinase [Mesonia hippocampi]|uniref:Tetraacyldisaccharide 4'-kinase n=1 Tax=Mesonia hippocampi TaxID=1628250 RepID=A0A840ESB1_9FLAO|nr:tetraacyldisaccharide 4'-kinase [Mesonia hippocampi]MBB4117827.1 tetraacyldisaccharide 4'-kinase [Mesonia hippocampi]
MQKKLRKILLYPFSLLYGLGVYFHILIYSLGIKKVTSYNFPIICVGNLSVGGTGKSPMIELLLKIFQENNNLKNIATLSRGYKRKTKGFILLNGKETAQEVGDEPLQFKQNFPLANIAVCEDRRIGIKNLQKLPVKPSVILLDDAFQHRKIKAGFNMLLTSYDNLYCRDYLLPAGNLREPRSRANNANYIIVTKCPDTLSLQEKKDIIACLNPTKNQQVFFAGISYAEKVKNKTNQLPLAQLPNFTLVTGIAKPKPLLDFLNEKKLKYTHLKYPDHHNFSKEELAFLKEKELIITTQKDYMRLKNVIPNNKIFYLPIETKILDDTEIFKKGILKVMKL